MKPSYRYRAEVGRVVDGDTIDAVIDLGFYIKITERLRPEGLDTPRIQGVRRTSEEYRKGIEARTYVERRLAQNGNRMLVETGKRERWRRWIATIYLADSPKSLNEELIEKGLARRVEE
jgi:micrococcal nuclease